MSAFSIFTIYYKLLTVKIIAIGEQFRKAASGLGIAAMVLSRGATTSLTKMVVEDLVMFQFSSDFVLEDVKIFDKHKSGVELVVGAGLIPTAKLGLLVDALGGFDYYYTQKLDGNEAFTVGYVDYERIKGEKNKYIFGAITYADGDYTTDKVDLSSDATSLRVAPAKEGYIMISEYYKKAKRLDVRLEKINY